MSDWRFVEYRNVDRKDWCERPAFMVNVVTGESYLARCKATRSSRCEFCAGLHRGDVAAVGRSGWTDRPDDRGFFVTLTAPGADLLPWDSSRCTHPADMPCSGVDLGCQVDPVAAALWHEDIGQRWSWFVTEMRRQLGVEVQFFKTWELQSRGVLHAHIMFRTGPGVSERRVRAALRLSRLRWGFGKQMKVDVINLSDSLQAARVAGYCAKYASKNADALPDIRRLNRSTGELRSGGLRSWSSSRSWGSTMSAVKLRRCQWAVAAAVAATGGTAVTPGGGAEGVALDPYQHHYATGGSDQSVDHSLQPL